MRAVRRNEFGAVWALAAAGILAGTAAHAQSGAGRGTPRTVPVVDAPVVLDVAPGAAFVEPAAVRDAVARELHSPVVPPGAVPAGAARGTLRIVADAEQHLILSFRDAAGHEVWRVVTLPRDPTAAIATIAFLAGNLARDEASELAAELQQPAPSTVASAPEPEPEAPPPVAPVRDAEPATPEPAQPETLPAFETIVPRSAEEAAAEHADFTPVGRQHDPHAARLGFYGAVGASKSGAGNGYALSTGITYALMRNLALDLTFGVGSQTHFTDAGGSTETRYWFGPMAAARLPVGPFRLEAAAGFGLQIADVGAFGYSGSYATGTAVGIGLQGRVGLYVAVMDRLDVFAQGFGTLGLSGNVWGPDGPIDTWWFTSGLLGVQARFL